MEKQKLIDYIGSVQNRWNIKGVSKLKIEKNHLVKT